MKYDDINRNATRPYLQFSIFWKILHSKYHACFIHAKFHSQSLTGSGFMTEGLYERPASLSNVKKSPGWLGLKIYLIGYLSYKTIKLVFYGVYIDMHNNNLINVVMLCLRIDLSLLCCVCE